MGGFLKVVGSVLAIYVMFVWLMPSSQSGSTGTAAQTTTSAPDKLPDPSPKDGLTLKHNRWWLDGFGTIMMLDVTIVNDNPYAVKDIHVECSLSGNSGTNISKADKVLYERIDAGQKKRFPKINMGFVDSQSTGTLCRIVGASAF